MKTIKIPVIISFSILFAILLFGCSASNSTSNENDNNGTNFVTGQILMVNNEPFSRVAIVTEKSVYLMDVPEDVKKTLFIKIREEQQRFTIPVIQLMMNLLRY